MNKITFFSEIPQQTLKIYEQKCDNYSKPNSILHASVVVPDDGTQYEQNPSSHHGGMCEDTRHR